MARPSGYKEEFAEQAEKLCLLGATDQEIADFFAVSVRTVYRWKGDHEAFCQALKVGKESADERVERSLFQRAVGYEQDEVKIFLRATDAEPVYAPFRAKIAPDTTAAIFWLKNRRRGDWRDKQDIEHSGSITTSSDPSAIADQLVSMANANPTMSPVIRDWAEALIKRLPVAPT